MEEEAIYRKNWSLGGDGFGDFTERDILLVGKDLHALLNSPKTAESIYGVKADYDKAMKKWVIDPESTKKSGRRS